MTAIARSNRGHRVKGITHYAVLIFIGVLALFPMYFMAVSGLRNGIQLQTHPFSLSFAKPFGTFYSQAWSYLEGDFLRTGLIIACLLYTSRCV